MTLIDFPKPELLKRLDEDEVVVVWPIHASPELGKPFGDINGSVANPPEEEVNDLARFKDAWPADITDLHTDAVNPAHYKAHPSGVECIQITEHMNFCCGNAVKYIWRHAMKGGKQDLEKAIWYLQRELRRGDQAS
jgi:hypothetical protein